MNLEQLIEQANELENKANEIRRCIREYEMVKNTLQKLEIELPKDFELKQFDKAETILSNRVDIEDDNRNIK